MSEPKQIPFRPPNFDEIAKVFPMAYQIGTIFAYAPNIYVPAGKPLPRSLVAHESVHIERQEKMGVDEWWKKYLDDVQFRYDEELLAHRVEYRVAIEDATCRQMRRGALKGIAKRLTSQLYGGIVSLDKAMEDITA